MRLQLSWLAPATFLSLAAMVACSSTTPTYFPGPGASPIPQPTRTVPGVTPTPSQAPSASPTGVALSCTSPSDALPGTYTSFFTEGNVTGSTYTQNATLGSGTWEADAYTVATASPIPSASPVVTPTPSASPTTYVIYEGAYTVTGFAGTGSTGPYTASATTGCAFLATTQNGQPIATGFNADGLGEPIFDSSVTAVNFTPLATGNITALTVTNLSPTSGTGSFVLDNAATGTITIQSSQIATFERVRQMIAGAHAAPYLIRHTPIRY